MNRHDPVEVPDTNEPILVLTSVGLDDESYAYFVLYGGGLVLFGRPLDAMPEYQSAMLVPPEIAALYAQVSGPDFEACDGERFTKSEVDLFSGTHLLSRRPDGSYRHIATESLPPYGQWPEGRRPPKSIEAAIALLANYARESTARWTPSQIEVLFQPAVPSPGHRAWWPKSWPQFDESPSRRGKNNIASLMLDRSLADELARLLKDRPTLRLRTGSYQVWVRFPLPSEDGIVAEIRRFDSSIEEHPVAQSN